MNGDVTDPVRPMLDISVGEFSQRLGRMLQRKAELQRIAITGEVSDWHPRGEQGVYFSLRDSNSVLSCYAYASAARKFPQIAKGVSVRAVGAVRTWAGKSEYQLLTDELTLAGVGAIAAAVEALREKLRREGAFDQSRRRLVPRFPQRVALITSPLGDARADFERQLKQRAPNVSVLFFPAAVQGQKADIEIADALRRASASSADVIVVGRGGGSEGDRSAFNSEPVVRAILASRIPVITAIGHVPNVHLADEVADFVAGTPTSAVDKVTSEWARTLERLRNGKSGLLRGYREVVTRSLQRLEIIGRKLEYTRERLVATTLARIRSVDAALNARNPIVRLAAWGSRLARLSATFDALRTPAFERWHNSISARDDKLTLAAERVIGKKTRELEISVATLLSLDPALPLKRGYAILRKAGDVVRDVSRLSRGDELTAQLGQGSLVARVEIVNET